MTAVRVSAPGKLFLLGEYAVLDGAPALLAASEQRVTATVSEAQSWSLTSHGIGAGSIELGRNGTLPHDLDERESLNLRLFDEVRRCVEENFGEADRAFDIIIDSSALHDRGRKLGLGSSAAVAVALTTALARIRGIVLDPSELFTLAHSAHRASQGGSGSGGDIAACIYGGVILYTPDHVPAAVSLPAGTRILAVSTGGGSSTADLIGEVENYRVRAPEQYRRDMAALRKLAASASGALDSTAGLMRLADEYFDALAALAEHSGAGIVTARHLEFRRLAARYDAVFKPGGAGGGDLGLVFAKLESVDELESAFTEAGALVIFVPSDADGVRVESA